MMDRIDLVNYRPELASAIAHMWNNSQDGWGGGNTIKTTEQVLQEEATSDALAVFLAMDDEQVAGYCSFGEYREDTGALYIPLLNVSPEYQGQKIGKLLVLRAVEETIKLGWPRLDLYTWAGNTKAIPLYKKCGFFWESRDDSTHLMNFIPSVLQTDAIAHYFDSIDWYRDSTRIIEVEPDGRTENGFDYYEYSWQRDALRLRVEFERRGRGLRLIETDDYLLSASIDQAELVFGSQYPVTYRIINKSGKPLHVTLSGENDKNIAFDLNEDVHVQGEVTITGHFHVGEIDREQSAWMTHPCVRTKVSINGKAALFQIGIVPKFPASLSLSVPGTLHYLNKRELLYLNMQNNFPETATFSLELPEAPFLLLEQQTITFTAKAKERVSIPLPYQLVDFGFYEPAIPITASLADGRNVSFVKKAGAAFLGLGAKLSGETEKGWIISHGKHMIVFDKEEHELYLKNSAHDDSPPTFMYPRIGKPYSSEFSKKEPESVVFFEERGGIGMTLRYRSNDFKDILLASHSLLYGDGTVEQWYELTNAGDIPTANELSLLLPVTFELHQAILPYADNFIEMNDSQGDSFEYWESSKVTENWLFARNDGSPNGISWPEEFTLLFDSWRIQLERQIGQLAAHTTVTTQPIRISTGAFTDWREYRAFALESTQVEDKPLYRHHELIVNERNPFTPEGELEATVTDHKLQYLDGDLTLQITAATQKSDQTRTFTIEDEQTEATFHFAPLAEPGIQMVTSSLRSQTLQTQFTNALFPVQKGTISTSHGTRDGFATLLADNGLIRLEAAPDFYPALLSLETGKKEWLDRSFPNLTAKSWWNPYPGGLFNLPQSMHDRSLIKENRSGTFAVLRDSKGNRWEGIKISVEIKEQEAFAGLIYHQYFLLLPGVPVLCHTVEIEQQTGTYFNQEEWHSGAFLNMTKATESWVRTHNSDGEPVHMTIGYEEGSVAESASLLFGTSDSSDKMQVVIDQTIAQMEVYFNKEATHLSISNKLDLAHGNTAFIPPVFFLFTGEAIADSALHALRTIRF